MDGELGCLLAVPQDLSPTTSPLSSLSPESCSSPRFPIPGRSPCPPSHQARPLGAEFLLPSCPPPQPAGPLPPHSPGLVSPAWSTDPLPALLATNLSPPCVSATSYTSDKIHLRGGSKEPSLSPPARSHLPLDSLMPRPPHRSTMCLDGARVSAALTAGCILPHAPVLLQPDFTISPLTGSTIHSAPPNRTHVSSPPPSRHRRVHLAQPSERVPRHLHLDHFIQTPSSLTRSLQQPPFWSHCLLLRGLHPLALKPSGHALATLPMSPLTTLLCVPAPLASASSRDTPHSSRPQGLCTCLPSAWAHLSSYLSVIWVSAPVPSSESLS